MSSDRPVEGPTELESIRGRARAGIVAIVLRSVIIRVLGLAGSIILARELLPRDFGILALGLTATTIGKFLVNGGLVSALIRREEPPTRDELDAVLGMQLLVAVVATVAVAGIALGFEEGEVVALMALVVPIEALRTAPYAVAERDLDYRLLARVEVLETLLYNVVAVGVVLAGAGVLGVAAAFVVKTVVGTVLLLWRGPTPMGRPRWALDAVRPLVRFGLPVQGAWFSVLAREQTVNLVLASLAGTAALGLWALTTRLIQTVQLLTETIARVLLPTMARLLQAGENPRFMLERGARSIAVVTGAAGVGLVAPAPALVPLVFGDEWTTTAELVPFAAAALLFSGPIGSCGTSYLYAIGRSVAVLRSSIAATATAIALTAALVPLVGVVAVGGALLAAAIVASVQLDVHVHRESGVHLLRQIAAPVGVTAAIATAGWLFVDRADPEPLVAIGALLVAEGLYLIAVQLLVPDTVAQLQRMLADTLRPHAGRLGLGTR